MIFCILSHKSIKEVDEWDGSLRESRWCEVLGMCFFLCLSSSSSSSSSSS